MRQKKVAASKAIAVVLQADQDDADEEVMAITENASTSQQVIPKG